jgi:ADP-heptose:LPS heptosyltransferase
MVFAPDTGISHAASAFRKPSLVLLKREHKPYPPMDTRAEIIAWNEREFISCPTRRFRDGAGPVVGVFRGLTAGQQGSSNGV